jgi:hypothetical protein
LASEAKVEGEPLSVWALLRIYIVWNRWS